MGRRPLALELFLLPALVKGNADFRLNTDVRRGEFFFKGFLLLQGRKLQLDLKAKAFSFPGERFDSLLALSLCPGHNSCQSKALLLLPGGTVTQKNGQQELWASPGLAT